MTPAELMASRSTAFGMVIFDCDGVLIDSEMLSNRVVAEEVSALGWPMTTDEATDAFMGTTVDAIETEVRARVGPLPEGWRARVMARIVAVMASEVESVPGAVEALQAVDRMGIPWRIASNSSHPELRAKFQRMDWVDLVAGRVHSHTDVRIGKPAPDLFLHAAAQQGVDPADCLVIEDSVAGATAARAAGMACLGLDRHGDGAALQACGAAVFHDMRELGGLIALARKVAA